MKTIIVFVVTLMITGCSGSGINSTTQMNALPDTLQIGQSILSRDTVEPVDYPTLTDEQLSTLKHQTALDIPDGTQLIGARQVGKGIILEAYKISMGEDPNQFKVILMTHDNKGQFVDALDLHEFHTSEHQGPMRFGGNRFYTTDAELRFNDARHFTLHRVMTLTSLYLKDHSLTEAWRVEWDNNYEIDATGHFAFKGQKETLRAPNDIDNPIIEEFKSRDLPLK